LPNDHKTTFQSHVKALQLQSLFGWFQIFTVTSQQIVDPLSHLQMSGSALFNLSLLTSDMWAVAVRALVFRQPVRALLRFIRKKQLKILSQDDSAQ
jgi:hypothetical protein